MKAGAGFDVGRLPSFAKRGSAVAKAMADKEGTPPTAKDETWDDFRWLVEEFRVSLFAQELGTAGPVSAVRLQRALEEIKAGGAASVPAIASASAGPFAAAARTESAPYLKPATAEKKAAPLKSLGALDQLFRK